MSTDSSNQQRNEDDDDAARPSKSQRKRDMHALQETGNELVELNAEQLASMNLPEDLFAAVSEARRIRNFEGRRRQMQYIGKLMRDVDPAPIRAQLEQWRSGARKHTELQHSAERWRARIMDEADAADAFAALHPRAHAQHLRKLVASIKNDIAAQRPPRKYRELFRIVREALGAKGRKASADATVAADENAADADDQHDSD